jgi:hypothetical protein
MKYKHLVAALLVIVGVGASGQAQNWSGIVVPSRATDWSAAGVVGGIPNRTTICATLNPGASASQINAAIASCPANQVVFLNPGTYNLNTGIIFDNKNNITLRGAGPDQTFLVFSGGNSCVGPGGDVCLRAGDNGDGGDGNYSNNASWTAGYSVGTTSITLSSAANLKVGSLLFLDQLDDASDTGQVFVCSASGVCSEQGSSLNGRPGRGQDQPVIVTSISGSTVGISPGIRMPNIAAGRSPGAWWDNGPPVQGDGIEDLSMDHSGTSTSIAAGTFVMNGYNNWVKNVRDMNSQHKHIWMYQTLHMTVRDSYFYGSAFAASESYGLDTYNGADNLFENNIFQHIASPVIQEGCIGCVMSYNYAIDDYYTNNGAAPQWQQASSYHHSVGDAFILWESNSGIGYTADEIHGTSNFITAFRNYWNGRDPLGGSGGGKTQQTSALILDSYNRYYNIIGNVLGTAGYHTNYTAAPPSTNCDSSVFVLGWGGNCSSTLPNDPLVAATIMRWGNYDTVNATNRFLASEVPSAIGTYANGVPASQNLPVSFYLNSKPAWWGTVPWPAIGPDVTSGNVANLGGHVNKIPAQVCYENTSKTNGIMNFNANTCYAQNRPAPPTNVTVLVQ